VVAGLVAVHVILPEQLERFREDGDLGVAAVVLRGGGSGMQTNAEKDDHQSEARDGAEQKAALHEKSNWLGGTMIAHAEIFGNAQSVG
jgi:hypothetical protein